MRILVVEDYEPLRSALSKGLTENGYAVDATGDGEEGLWYASNTTYDLIILDLLLPGLNGLELLRRLRDAHNKSHVLILTAMGNVQDRVAGLDGGADDYLTKPFDFGELLARTRALVRRSYRRKDPLVRVGPLEMDTGSRQVRLDGQSIDLTAREYALLELLTMRAGEVVSRSDLWEHIYPFDSDTSSNVVDVYIGYLRRKLSLHSHAGLIQTRRGHGYVLAAET
jgi:DNA-binding response OmpR family regulator